MEKTTRKPLTRKTPLRRSFLDRSKRPKESYLWKKAGFKKKSKPLKKVGKSRAKQHSEYRSIQKSFLEKNPYCELCLGRTLGASLQQAREILRGDRPLFVIEASGGSVNPATEVHHRNGRIGRLLCYEPFFIASCRRCREWPHEIALKTARDLGFIAPASEWNVFPDDLR